MRVVIVDDVHHILIDKLEKSGFSVDYHPNFNYEETCAIIKDYEGLVVRSKFNIDKDLIEKGENLKFLARAGVGLDIFDLEYAEKRNIKVINAAGANANSVAEHTLGLLLNMMHNINVSSNQVENFEWKREENRGDEIFGKIVGIIGYGNTGKAVARKLNAFSCEVLAYDKNKENYSDEYVKESTMEQIFQYADIVTLHIPLTEDTLYMCDQSYFHKFQKSIYFINTSRGKIVKTQSLLECIENGKIRKAALDVLENEKLDKLDDELLEIYNKMLKNDNILITPHIAGWSFQSYKNISLTLLDKIRSLTC